MLNNHFAWTKSAKDENAPQRVEITLNETIYDTIMTPLKERWLLPILQGERRELLDGQTYHCFYLECEDAELLKQAVLEVYTKLSGYNTTN